MSSASGRKAKPTSISLLPDEREELRQFEAFTGVGPTQLYRERLSPQVHAAVQLFYEMQESGMEIKRAAVPHVWDTSMSAEDLAELYAAASVLELGE